MASVRSNTYEGRYLQLDVWEKSYSVADNTSLIGWKLSSVGGTSSYYQIAATTARVAGEPVYYKDLTPWDAMVFPAKKGEVSGEITVAHDSNGAKTIGFSLATKVYIDRAPAETASTLVLTDIPRAATVDTLSSSNGLFTGTITVSYSPKSSAYYNRCKVALNLGGDMFDIRTVDLGQRQVSQQQEKITFSAEELETVYGKYPNDSNGYVRISISTYLNADYTGQVGDGSYKEIQLYIPDDATTKPTIFVSLQPVWPENTPAALTSIYVQGKSKVQAYSFETAGKFGASIEATGINVSGKDYGMPDYTSDIISGFGAMKVACAVRDSRGFYGNDDQEIYVHAYSKPQIVHADGDTEVVVARCDENGAASDSGTYLKIKARRSFYKLIADNVQRNYCKLRCACVPAGSSAEPQWVDILSRTATNDTVAIGPVPGVALSLSVAYTVILQAVDDVGEIASLTVAIPTEQVYMERNAARNAMAIGKRVEENDTLDVAWNIHARKNLTVDGGLVLRGDAVADYIIAAGTQSMGDNGTWYWHKWASGKAECYGCRSFGDIGVTVAWGNLYGSPDLTQSLPQQLFIDIPAYTNVNISRSIDGFAWIHQGSGNPSAVSSVGFSLTRPNPATLRDVHLGFHVIGRWK